MEETKILIADDDWSIRDVFTSIFKDRGYININVAEDGNQALSELLEGDYDLCVTDSNMPKLWGFDVIREYRKQKGESAKTKFIGTSGFDAATSDPEYGSLGVPFVQKPASPEKLYSLTDMLLEKRKGALCVEDPEQYSRPLSSDILSEEGHPVVTANNGPTAINLFNSLKQSISLVLLDTRIPTQECYDVLKEVQSPDYKVPVIAMTNSTDTLEQKHFAAWCGDSLAKPYERETLLEKVAKYIEVKRN